MQSLRTLTLSGVFSLPSSSNPSILVLQRRLAFSLRRFLHIGGRGLDDDGSSDEKPVSWSSYDPFTDRVDFVRDEEWNPKTRRHGRRMRSSDGESSEGEGKGCVMAVYDPIEGRMVSRIIRDEGQVGVEGEMMGVEKNPSVGDGEEGRSKVAGKRSIAKLEPTGDIPRNKFSVVGPGASRKKEGKTRVSWVCGECGNSYGQWWGICPSCHKAGTLAKFSEDKVVPKSWLQLSESVPRSLADLNKTRDKSEWRIPLTGHLGMEVARALGGGIVPGSLILVGGDPGVGKSTLLLQIADMVAQDHNRKEPVPVVYVSGEESIEQLANRAERLKLKTKNLFLYSSTDVEDILDKVQKLGPGALIVDSIQTVYLSGLTGSAGNAMQVKECTSTLLRFAKETNVPVFLIGHVTKTGDIAGPKILEHIVDVVLYVEGERYSSYRLLRSVKNRFGSTDEIGVFELSESGLQAVLNPSDMFMTEHSSDSDVLTGLAVAVIVDGSRSFLIEIQALCVTDSSAVKQVNGIPASRADMIISVLMKQAGLKLQNNSIFLNVVSGVKLTETAGDLAIAAAICSSFLEIPIPADIAFVGEVGLGGELRSVPRMDKRVMAVAKLGYKKCIVPLAATKSLGRHPNTEIVGCKDLKHVINILFQADQKTQGSASQ